MCIERENVDNIHAYGTFIIKEGGNKILKTPFEESIIEIQIIPNSMNYKIYLKNKNENENSQNNLFSFEIKETLKFSYFIRNNEEYIQWISEQNIYFFKFMKTGTNNKDIFLYILDQCLDSIKNNISFEESYIKNIEKLGVIKNLEDYANTIIPLEKSPEVKLSDIIDLEKEKKIFSAKGEIYNYNSEKESLINISENIEKYISIYHLTEGKVDYILCTETLDNFLISFDEIDEKINGQLFNNKNKNFFAWETNKSYANIKGKCLGFLFEDSEEALNFKLILEKCVQNMKIKNNEKENNLFFSGTKSFYYGNEEEKKFENEENIKEKYEIMDIDDKFNELETPGENINKFTLDSILNDRTFCFSNNNQINIFKINQENDTFEKLSSTPIIKEYKGNNISIDKGILYKGEQNILLFDQKNPYNLFQYDLNKEKIINDWNTEGIEISDFCPKFKNGQKIDDPIVYGLNPKSIFSMDSRVHNKNNIVEIHNYKICNNANRIMSTNNGQFVTGGTKGEIRLFNKIAGRAKNLFIYYGDSVKHIDISSDDKYILITYDKYLMLINATAREGKHSGFLKNIRAHDRIAPIRLEIKYSDIVKYGLENYHYTNAKFNCNKNGENNIITSLGSYVIIWNFSDVIKAKLINYKIKKVDQIILDNSFKVGKGNKIIITMPNKMRIQNQITISNDYK